MNMIRLLAHAAVATLIGSSAAAQTAPTLAQANGAYYQGRYGDSLRAFEQLAAAGNAEAAECAGLMLLQGPSLYGPQVPRDTDRARVLLLQAAQAGRPAAQFLLNMIERTD